MATMTNNADRLKIIVGLDFSSMSDRALQVAVNLGRAANAAELHLVHVIAPPIAGTELAPIMDVGEVAQTARKNLAELTEKLAPIQNINVVSHVLVGDPQRELPRLADENEADLIVIGTHGRRGLDRALFGSVAEHVVRYAPCSVLTVRPTKPSAASQIEPPCPACVEITQKTNGVETRCLTHAKHHARAHTYSEVPPSFGVGSMTFRF